MNHKLYNISMRRDLLIKQANQQREALAYYITPLRKSLLIVDKGLSLVNYVKKHPVLIMAISTVIGMLSPGSTIKWLGRSWIVSVVMTGLKNWLMKI